jgi:hypothetical protein
MSVRRTSNQNIVPARGQGTDTGAVAGPKPINDGKPAGQSIKGEPAKSGLTTQAGLAESPNNRPTASVPSKVHSAEWTRAYELAFDAPEKAADEIERLQHELAVEKERADYAWKNTREIDQARISLLAERDLLRVGDPKTVARTVVIDKEEYGKMVEELKLMQAALCMMYDKWEDGPACYEDGDTDCGSLGHAVQLSEAEENQILALLPALRSSDEEPGQKP